jgi:hypothetical protein
MAVIFLLTPRHLLSVFLLPVRTCPLVTSNLPRSQPKAGEYLIFMTKVHRVFDLDQIACRFGGIRPQAGLLPYAAGADARHRDVELGSLWNGVSGRRT